METTVIDGKEYALMPLSQGKHAIVDVDMLKELNRWKWSCNGNGYAAKTFMRGPGGQTIVILMHRLVAQTSTGIKTDHINGNKIDNRRCNLRIASTTENNRNRPLQRSNKLGVKGVFIKLGRFEVSIRAGGKSIYVGRFQHIADAVAAYNEAAVRFHGAFARLSETTPETLLMTQMTDLERCKLKIEDVP